MKRTMMPQDNPPAQLREDAAIADDYGRVIDNLRAENERLRVALDECVLRMRRIHAPVPVSAQLAPRPAQGGAVTLTPDDPRLRWDKAELVMEIERLTRIETAARDCQDADVPFIEALERLDAALAQPKEER